MASQCSISESRSATCIYSFRPYNLLSLQTFLTGETVSGELHFTLTEAKSYKQIHINLYGGALVKWTETYSSGPNGQTSTVTYKDEETYVDKMVVLWSKEHSADGTIGPGTYNLPFQFEIPHNCLGSFEGKHGSIRYSLRGHIKTGTLKLDHDISVPLTVNRLRDINTIPRLLAPVLQSQRKVVGFFNFGSTIEFTASLTRTGFCIGNTLPLTVSVLNGSGRRIKIRASLQRLCTFHVRRHKKHSKEKLAIIVSPDVSPHSQYTWNVEDFMIPMVEPSFEESAIIKMQYYLKVTAVIPWATNSSVMIPITLGNVPLNEFH